MILNGDPKSKFSITVLTVKSSLDIKPGKYLWNTSCSAAHDLFKYLNKDPRLKGSELGKLDLIRNEHGYTITERF